MKKLLHALAALSLLAAPAWGQPIQLSDKQMDKVSAGFLEVDRSNTSLTVITMWFRPSIRDEETPNFIACTKCYLLIVTPTFAIASNFGPFTPFTSSP